MITGNNHIEFDFMMESARFNIRLQADVEEHHSNVYYLVKNIRAAGHEGPSILPDIRIHKRHGLWVHTDSGKETHLSLTVGQALDALISSA